MRGIRKSSLKRASELGLVASTSSIASGASGTSATSGYNPHSLFPVKFVWDYHGAESVHLWMSTAEGKHTTPMNRIKQGAYTGAHEVTVKIKPGRCEFRYLEFFSTYYKVFEIL